MPRRNRRGSRGTPGSRDPRRDRGPGPDLSWVLESAVRTESYAGGRWTVRPVRGNDQGRDYRCPGCQQHLSGAVPHVVVWPADGLGGLEDRRHWHTPCWRARDRRPPRGSWR